MLVIVIFQKILNIISILNLYHQIIYAFSNNFYHLSIVSLKKKVNSILHDNQELLEVFNHVL